MENKLDEVKKAITPGERMTQMQIKGLRNDMDGKLAGIQAQLNQRERLSPEEEKSIFALQAYLRKGGSEQELRNLTRKPMIKVAICLLYNSKCIDLQYDEKRVLPTTEQEMGKNG